MIPDKITIWTPRGYQKVEELSVGEKIISYNPAKGYNEYDTIKAIETTWTKQGIIGIRSQNRSFILDEKHPMLISDPKNKTLTKIPAKNLFIRKTSLKQCILAVKPFEPYQRTQNFDDIAWTARLAASSSRRTSPALFSKEIWNCIAEITAEEAQHWLHTFFHWNILKSKPQTLKTTLVRNNYVKNMLWHVAPRAGVGTLWAPYLPKKNFYKRIYAFSIVLEGDKPIDEKQWVGGMHEGVMYNITTGNGNFLGKYGGSTIMLACNEGE